MSSPQHPTGSGPQPWQDQPPQYPGQNAQQPGGQPPAYGSGPGQFGSAPGPAYGSAPGPYGSAPGQPAAQGPYGSAPAQYGSGPGPYGSAPGQYGSAPGPYGSSPGPYGSAPGQGQFGQAPAPKQRTGPGILGPLTLRDLFLLFAGLLAFIALFVPYRGYSYGFGRETTTLWHWNVADMGALVFGVLTILLIVAAVLVNKLGNSRLRVGSLSLDQFISVLSAIAFTYVFIDLLTSAVYWHVGSYLTFFAALIAFFAGVFTMLPFFAKEFAGREDIETHPKARPVAKHTQHPAPVANVPGAAGPGAGAPGFAPYGAVPAGPGQEGPGQPAQFGAPGQQDQFVGSGQSGQPAQSGQPGADQYGQSAQYGAPGQQDQLAAPEQQAQPSEQFGQPSDQEAQPSPYAPPQDQGAERSASSFAAPAAGASAAGAAPASAGATSDHDAADGPVHSTGDGQTYLGRHDSEAPQHSQSEPTQAFGVGAGQPQADATDGQPSASGDQPTTTDNQSAGADAQPSESDDSSHSGAVAAAAGAGVIGAGVAGVAAVHSDSERRRGRHAAPESETGAEPTDPTSTAPQDEVNEETSADKSAAASVREDEAPTVVSPAESSDLVSKVNSKTSDTNAAESPNAEGANVAGAASAAQSSTDADGASTDADQASAGDASADATSAEAASNASPAESSAANNEATAQGPDDDANVRSTEATVVSTPAEDKVVADDKPTADDKATADDDEQATAVMEPATGGERTTAPESEEPTQYVPVADYANRPETDGRSDRSNEETMAQTAVDSQPVPADAGQNRSGDAQSDGRNADQNNGQAENQDGGRPIIQAFWFAVPEPREAVDETTGMPVFTIYPGDWYLSLEDNGSWFKVRDSDGSTTGLLRNIEGIQRG